jgi:hypothetical protein
MSKLRGALTVLFLGCLIGPVSAEEAAPKTDSRYPFRIDGANEELPWYQLKPHEFPPHHSDHRVGGTLIEVDFIHRRGVLRENSTGQLVDFTMPPFGGARYLNSQAELRDIPLGLNLLFFLNTYVNCAFTKF